MNLADSFSYLGGHSTIQEKVAEYLFLQLLLLEGASRHESLDIGRNDIDTFGYDLLLRRADTYRLMQMKSHSGGSDGDGAWDVHKELLSNPTGAIICARLLPVVSEPVSSKLVIQANGEAFAVRFKLLNSGIFREADRTARGPKIDHTGKIRVYEREFVDITNDSYLLFSNAAYWHGQGLPYPRT